jgi:flagellar hook-associated protein 3 FlgL
MRLSEQARVQNQVSYLTAAAERMDRVQRQLSTNRRIDRASDDPTGAALAMQYRQSIAFEAQMRRNISYGTAFLNTTEAALGSATEVLQRIRELTVQAANDTLGPTDRQAIASEVNQLIEQLAQVANTTFGSVHIFSGHQTDTPAYNVAGTPPIAITWQGDAGQREIRVSANETVPINLIGDDVFKDLFDKLLQLRNGLQSGAPGAQLNPYLTNIDAGLDRVLTARAEVGARLNRFEATTFRSEETDTNLQELRAGVEDIDIAETIVRFTAAQNALQAALGAIGRTSNLTLLDFLR